MLSLAICWTEMQNGICSDNRKYICIWWCSTRIMILVLMILAWFLLSLSSVYILLGILYNDFHSNTGIFFLICTFCFYWNQWRWGNCICILGKCHYQIILSYAVINLSHCSIGLECSLSRGIQSMQTSRLRHRLWNGSSQKSSPRLTSFHVEMTSFLECF